MKRINKSTLTQEDVERIKDVISDAMGNLNDTILTGINVILAKEMPKEKLEDAVKLAETLIDIE